MFAVLQVLNHEGRAQYELRVRPSAVKSISPGPHARIEHPAGSGGSARMTPYSSSLRLSGEEHTICVLGTPAEVQQLLETAAARRS